MKQAKEAIISAKDNYSLGATIYYPSKKIKKSHVFFIAPAIGLKQKFYSDFAGFLAENGHTVLTFDYRGIGASLNSDIKKIKARMSDWGEKDIAGIIDWIRKKFKNKKLIIVTHSVGGQIVGLAENCNEINAAIMIASAHGGYHSWNFAEKIFVVPFFKIYVPLVTKILSNFPGGKLGLGDNLPKGVAYEWASWCMSPDYLFSKYPDKIRKRYSDLKIPIISYSFDDDILANKFRVERLMLKYSGADLTRRHILRDDYGSKPIGHNGYFNKRFRNTLWIETLKWISEL